MFTPMITFCQYRVVVLEEVDEDDEVVLLVDVVLVVFEDVDEEHEVVLLVDVVLDVLVGVDEDVVLDVVVDVDVVSSTVIMLVGVKTT